MLFIYSYILFKRQCIVLTCLSAEFSTISISKEVFVR